MLEAGVGHIPEDRHRRGLVLEFSIAENIALHDYHYPPLAVGLALPARLVSGPRADQGVRRPRRRPADEAGALSGATSRSSSPRASLPRPRYYRRAADARPRRRLDRVPALPPTRGAGRRAARSCWSRSRARRGRSRSPTASGHVRGTRSSADTLPGATEDEIGIEMLGGRRKEA